MMLFNELPTEEQLKQERLAGIERMGANRQDLSSDEKSNQCYDIWRPHPAFPGEI
jgi:hypothetical protein